MRALKVPHRHHSTRTRTADTPASDTPTGVRLSDSSESTAASQHVSSECASESKNETKESAQRNVQLAKDRLTGKLGVRKHLGELLLLQAGSAWPG